MLPSGDGFEVCRRLRAQDNAVPIIMVTARDEDIDKILGLEIARMITSQNPSTPAKLGCPV